MSTLIFPVMFIFFLFGTLGLLAGIVLIVVWWLRVKNTVALFYDPKKIRATVFLLVPGLILIGIGLYFRFAWTPSPSDYSDYTSDYVPEKPTLATIYLANYSDKVGRLETSEYKDTLAPKSEREISIRTDLKSDTLRFWLGDSLVLDTIIEEGTYIGNFSDDISVSAEEVIYSSMPSSTEEPEFLMLSAPGIRRFTASVYETIYGFGDKAPTTMSVSSTTSRVVRWDVETLTDEQLIQMLIEAVGTGDGELEEGEEE